MELTSPTKKKGRYNPNHPSLPILNDHLNKFNGYFNGFAVVVDGVEEISTLNKMGFFGKGSLSRGGAKFGKINKDLPLVLSETQWARRQEWMNNLKSLLKTLPGSAKETNNVICKDKSELLQGAPSINTEKNNSDNLSLKDNDVTPMDDEDVQIIEDDINYENPETKESTDLNQISEKEILVLPDNMEEELEKQNELKALIVTENFQIVSEQLHLTLEEAFFLTFALGCISICDLAGQYLNIQDMWMLFNNAQSDFIESYVAYHYFRAKGWVVKSGLKFGGNFLLYKGGPPFYHASYIVIIENINKLKCPSKKTSWEEMIAVHRMGEASKKEILTCQILWPDDLKDINSPKILHLFEVNEILLRRWLPGQEKDDE